MHIIKNSMNLVPVKRVYSSDEQLREHPEEHPEKEEHIEFTEEHNYAIKLFDDRQNILITGAAGTGKTTLIRHLLTKRPDILVCATTGVASLQYDGGTTLHSALKIPVTYPTQSELIRHYSALRATFERHYRPGGGEPRHPKARWVYSITKIDTIFIDEISMASAYLLECVDTALRILRKIDKPFGGVQCVLIGDYAQLEPVYDKSQRYKDKSGVERGPPPNQGKLSFTSPLWRQANIHTIQLTRVFRQENKKFQTLLSKIRMDEPLDSEEFQILQTCQTRPRPADDVGVYIMHTRKQVHAYNLKRQNELGDVSTVTYRFPYSTICTADEDEYKGLVRQTSDALQLVHGQDTYAFKVGDKVMLIRNGEYPIAEDHGEGEYLMSPTQKIKLVNGDIGFVIDFTEEKYPVVRIYRNNEYYAEVVVQPVEFKRTRVDTSSKDGEITLANINVIPAILAWAITVHKAQGTTLRDVSIIINCTNLDWVPNAFYVALSRATAIEQVFLEEFKGYRQSRAGIEFYKNSNNFERIEHAEALSATPDKIPEIPIEHHPVEKDDDNDKKNDDNVLRETKTQLHFQPSTTVKSDVLEDFNAHLYSVLNQFISHHRGTRSAKRKRDDSIYILEEFIKFVKK